MMKNKMKRLNNLYEEFKKIQSIEKHFQVFGHKFSVERKDETTFQFNMNVDLPEFFLPQIIIFLFSSI
jgi:hypothetical protein